MCSNGALSAERVGLHHDVGSPSGRWGGQSTSALEDRDRRGLTLFPGGADTVSKAHACLRVQPLGSSGGSALPRHAIGAPRRGSLGRPSPRRYGPGGTGHGGRGPVRGPDAGSLLPDPSVVSELASHGQRHVGGGEAEWWTERPLVRLTVPLGPLGGEPCRFVSSSRMITRSFLTGCEF